ncbi:hypothetical protein NDU88_009474 [Pleurodeles waltl]|uniref:Uncharacterized protein n=1 Tax=Pleurodeles waltl TaxID=8319 RepID=A0AAV7QXF5_PLEWA|nr:hypothetical protein NDU88_009474 [Pleurodeles waltl]
MDLVASVPLALMGQRGAGAGSPVWPSGAGSGRLGSRLVLKWPPGQQGWRWPPGAGAGGGLLGSRAGAGLLGSWAGAGSGLLGSGDCGGVLLGSGDDGGGLLGSGDDGGGLLGSWAGAGCGLLGSGDDGSLRRHAALPRLADFLVALPHLGRCRSGLHTSTCTPGSGFGGWSLPPLPPGTGQLLMFDRCVYFELSNVVVFWRCMRILSAAVCTANGIPRLKDRRVDSCVVIVWAYFCWRDGGGFVFASLSLTFGVADLCGCLNFVGFRAGGRNSCGGIPLLRQCVGGLLHGGKPLLPPML